MNQIATTYPAMPKNQNGLRLCHLLSTLALALLPAWAAAQTAPLNDTGQMQCVNNAGTWAAACDAGSTGNAATHPGQDGRFGRDAAQAAGALPPKTGGGAAGFDFTRLCWNGHPQGHAQCAGTLVANTTGTVSAPPATDWTCTRDNVTGLVWSLQTQSATWNAATASTYPDAGHNTPTRCGYDTGWRLPTRRELLSIVHNGAYSPAIDQTYFPGTASSWYWSSDTYAPDPAVAWGVFFYDGFAGADGKAGTNSTRLVRSGQ